MIANVGINSVNDKFNDMDRVNEIIGHLRDEEYDAVLYGVMLRFLEKKAKEYECSVYSLYLQPETDEKEIGVYIGTEFDSPDLKEHVAINEA